MRPGLQVTNHQPVEILIGIKFISVEYEPGTCRMIALD